MSLLIFFREAGSPPAALDLVATPTQRWYASGGVYRQTSYQTRTDYGLRLYVAPVAGQVPVGLAEETDLASALGKAKAQALGLATETDAASALARVKSKAVGLATETDSASALARVKAKATGLATETDLASSLARSKARATGLASETDIASSLARVKAKVLGLASETDTAYALTRPASVGLAEETDTASSLSRVKTRAVGLATESDTASNLSRVKLRLVGRADETDTASALAPQGTISAPVGLATETDEAFALTAVQGQAPQTEERNAGGYGWENLARLSRRRRRQLEEEEADRLEALLIEEGTLPPNPAVLDRITVREYAPYAKDFSRRTQRAIDYALKARTDLAYQLAAREIARQVEEEELTMLLILAAA